MLDSKLVEKIEENWEKGAWLTCPVGGIHFFSESCTGEQIADTLKSEYSKSFEVVDVSSVFTGLADYSLADIDDLVWLV
jgi:hypothetical protein